MLTKLDRLRIGQCDQEIGRCENIVVLQRAGLFPNIHLYRNIGNLASQSFAQLDFWVVRVKAVVAVSIHSLQVLYRVAGSGCGLLFSESCSVESVTTVGHYRMFDASSK
jgi:hypothetical protein